MALHSSASTPRALAQGHSRRPSVAVSSAASRNPSDSKSKSVRAPSAYNLYVKEHYQTVSARLKAKGLPADLTTVGKHLRQEWSALSDREKAPYNARSQKLKEEIGVGSRGSSPTRLQAVARPSSAVPARPVSPGPARPVSPGRPSSPAPSTKPLPPYEAFITEQFPAVKASHPNATPAEITRLIDEMWQRVPQAQKDAKAARYKVELQAHMNGTPASNGASRSSSSPQRSSSYSYTPAAPRAASPAPRAASPRPQSPRPTGPSNERPLPPQEAFAKEQYAVIKATYPKASENEINRMISDMWGKLPQSLKDAKAKRYESDLAAYNATGGSSASRTSSYSPAASRTSSPAARAASPAPRVGSPRPQSPRPTGPSNEKPLPPFEAFSKEQYLVIKASHPKSSDSEINRLIDELWQRVPQSQKDAKAKRYDAELAAYNASSGGSSRASSYSSYSPAASRTSSPARAASPATRTASPRPQSPRPTGPSNERPLPPQEAFAKEQYQVIKATYPKASDSEINRMISDMWGKLPQSLKDAKAKRYDSDLAAYNQSQGGARYSPSSSPRTSTVNVRRSPVGAGRR